MSIELHLIERPDIGQLLPFRQCLGGGKGHGLIGVALTRPSDEGRQRSASAIACVERVAIAQFLRLQEPLDIDVESVE